MLIFYFCHCNKKWKYLNSSDQSEAGECKKRSGDNHEDRRQKNEYKFAFSGIMLKFITTSDTGNAVYGEKSAIGEKPPVMSELSTTEIVFAISVKPKMYTIAEKRRMYTVYH